MADEKKDIYWELQKLIFQKFKIVVSSVQCLFNEIDCLLWALFWYEIKTVMLWVVERFFSLRSALYVKTITRIGCIFFQILSETHFNSSVSLCQNHLVPIWHFWKIDYMHWLYATEPVICSKKWIA